MSIWEIIAAVAAIALHQEGNRRRMSSSSKTDFTSFAAALPTDAVAGRLRATAPAAYAVASEFWRVPMAAEHLGARMKELILLAMHATSTALNAEAIKRHIGRAREAGATTDEVVDVLITISAVANHALYSTVPVLEEELRAAGASEDAPPDAPVADLEAAKREFIGVRGFWIPDRDRFAVLIPEYFDVLNAISTETWKNGPLGRLEREYICIAVDCTVTHNFNSGLRQHIRNAIKLGATRDQILQIFQLAALLGLEGYILGAQALFAGDGDEKPTS